MTVLNGSRLAMGWQPTMVFNPGWNWGRPERVGSLLEVGRGSVHGWHGVRDFWGRACARHMADCSDSREVHE